MAARRGTVFLLSICYALSVSTIALNVAIAPLVGLRLAPDPALATLPISLQILATMAASFPVAMLMGRYGRRAGHFVTTLIGLGAAGLAAAAIIQGNFVMFCFGTAGMGVLNSAAQQYRFAAADIADASWRPRAIAYVMAGGVAAGVLGPFVAVRGADTLATPLAGSYLAAVGLFAIVGLIVAGLRLGRPTLLATDAPARPLSQIVRTRGFMAAVLAGMASYGVMSLIMTGTPIAMRHEGHSLQATATVIQVHVVAMFAPSFVTGRLIGRYGERRIMMAGLLLFLGTFAVDLLGQSALHHGVALALLGIGWNFLFTSGTTMVTSVHTPSETAKVQGVNDLLVFGSAAAGSFLAGYVHDAAGWTALNLAIAPAMVLALLAWGLAAQTPRVPPTPA